MYICVLTDFLWYSLSKSFHLFEVDRAQLFIVTKLCSGIPKLPAPNYDLLSIDRTFPFPIAPSSLSLASGNHHSLYPQLEVHFLDSAYNHVFIYLCLPYFI